MTLSYIEMKKKSKAGRPKKIIDYKQCEELAAIFCTHEEIAGVLHVSVSTLEHDKKFLQVLNEFRLNLAFCVKNILNSLHLIGYIS